MGGQAHGGHPAAASRPGTCATNLSQSLRNIPRYLDQYNIPRYLDLSVDRSPQVDKLARAASNARGNYMATASALYSAQEITDSPSNNLIMAEPQINSGRLLLTVT